MSPRAPLGSPLRRSCISILGTQPAHPVNRTCYTLYTLHIVTSRQKMCKKEGASIYWGPTSPPLSEPDLLHILLHRLWRRTLHIVDCHATSNNVHLYWWKPASHSQLPLHILHTIQKNKFCTVETVCCLCSAQCAASPGD